MTIYVYKKPVAENTKHMMYYSYKYFKYLREHL